MTLVKISVSPMLRQRRMSLNEKLASTRELGDGGVACMCSRNEAPEKLTQDSRSTRSLMMEVKMACAEQRCKAHMTLVLVERGGVSHGGHMHFA